MWLRLSLGARIYIILGTLVLVTFMGGLVMVWYSYQMEDILAEIIEKDTAAFEAAQTLEIALVNQKGFVSYYFMDGNPDWLRQLGEYRQIFREQLKKVQGFISSEKQQESIRQITAEYELYVTSKDQVIAHYQNGDTEKGRKLHEETRSHFFKLLEFCEDYKNLVKANIMAEKIRSQDQSRQIRFMAGMAMALDFILGVLLGFVLMNHILEPVRELTREMECKDIHPKRREDEIKALSRGVRDLLENVDHTQSELERSREHLLQAEKMAMVGKLAAGMAHSIRNPFTSVKMRLFSLSRSLDLNDTQKEDFDVISHEIKHLDTIVQNFLEFSRPPKLKMQRISPSVVVDMALQLLEHRLRSYDVTARVIRPAMLPEVKADPEQLKEVLVNLMINACESMSRSRSGNIEIREETAVGITSEALAVIRVTDDGPGIPENIRQKIFEPFFTTREEGTGLGLSIATRIIREHRGRLAVTSQEGTGTTFVISLPLASAPEMENSGILP